MSPRTHPPPLAKLPALRVLLVVLAHGAQEVELAAHPDALPKDRTPFERHLTGIYGTTRVGKLFFETFARQAAHPDVLRYIEALLAETPAQAGRPG